MEAEEDRKEGRKEGRKEARGKEAEEVKKREGDEVHIPDFRAFASPFFTCPLAARRRSGSITRR